MRCDGCGMVLMMMRGELVALTAHARPQRDCVQRGGRKRAHTPAERSCRARRGRRWAALEAGLQGRTLAGTPFSAQDPIQCQCRTFRSECAGVLLPWASPLYIPGTAIPCVSTRDRRMRQRTDRKEHLPALLLPLVLWLSPHAQDYVGIWPNHPIQIFEFTLLFSRQQVHKSSSLSARSGVFCLVVRVRCFLKFHLLLVRSRLLAAAAQESMQALL
eukprot:2462500-Rhodomonas_salina.4